MQSLTTPAVVIGQHLSTEELAQILKITAQGIRKRFCVTGSYWGVRPVKLPSGRLLWPGDTVERLGRGAQ